MEIIHGRYEIYMNHWDKQETSKKLFTWRGSLRFFPGYVSILMLWLEMWEIIALGHSGCDRDNT